MTGIPMGGGVQYKWDVVSGIKFGGGVQGVRGATSGWLGAGINPAIGACVVGEVPWKGNPSGGLVTSTAAGLGPVSGGGA